MKKCKICESKEIGLRLKIKKDYNIYKCENCQVNFLYPFSENVEKIYDEKYFKRWYLNFYDERKKYFKSLLKKIEKYIPQTGKLIDVGCGVGIFLEVMKEKNYEVCGYDISDFAIDFCRKKGFNVYNKSFLELYFPESSFDLITFFDVVAHLKEPINYLQKCKKMLKKDGVILIKTPLHSNFLFFIAKFLSFIGKSKSILHLPAQIYHFDKNSILKIADITGFKIKKIIITREFINKRISLVNIWKFFFEKSMIVVLKNE